MGILDQLTLRLVTFVKRFSRQRLATWRIRSIVRTAAAALLALAVSGGYVYAIGYTSADRTTGEPIGRMASGPEVAADWPSLVAANDQRKAAASCEKSIAVDEHGRHCCAMLVWLDPPSAASS